MNPKAPVPKAVRIRLEEIWNSNGFEESIFRLFSLKRSHYSGMDRWFIVFACALTLGCGQESADELFTKGEAATHQDATYPEAKIYLNEFLERFPDDPRADLALQALARVLLNRGENEASIARYEELIRRFPTSRYADQAQFMIGYIYDLDGKYEQARTAYQEVVNGYPGSELIDDAQACIANLGKPPAAWFPPDSTTAGSAKRR